jgi:hypothetical protein
VGGATGIWAGVWVSDRGHTGSKNHVSGHCTQQRRTVSWCDAQLLCQPYTPKWPGNGPKSGVPRRFETPIFAFGDPGISLFPYVVSVVFIVRTWKFHAQSFY